MMTSAAARSTTVRPRTPARAAPKPAAAPPNTPTPARALADRDRDTFTPASGRGDIGAALGRAGLGIAKQIDQMVKAVPKPKVPAASTNMRNTNAAVPVDARLTNAPAKRSAANYSKVIDQFDVAKNPRYQKRNGNTYCNIFAWDVTRAMGAEIPHYGLDKKGRTVELDANATNKWLNGPVAKNHGWRPVTASEAQAYANKGIPAVASWNNPSGIGHIGVIRPGTMSAKGPAMAQAGSQNFSAKHVQDGFGARRPQYFVFDPPGTRSLDNGPQGGAKPS